MSSEENRRAWTASRTLWTRLEPRTRDTKLDRVLRAEVHDPAWMLCRQWQVGEFQGEDAGSPVDASLSWEHDHMSRFRLGRDPDIETGPDDPTRLHGGGPSSSLADEIADLGDLVSELDDHREAQVSGGGDPDPVRDAFARFVGVSRSGGFGGRQPPGSRRRELQFLTASVLPDPTASGRVSFFERARQYIDTQPASEVTAMGISIDQLVSELEGFVSGAGSGRAARSILDELLDNGAAVTTKHLREVFVFAMDAATAYRSQQSTEGSDGEAVEPNPVQDYEGEPLEALVEHEAVAAGLDADERPPARLRTEAGQQFLRFLADHGYTDGDSTYTAGQFTVPGSSDGGRFVLSSPDEPLAPVDRQFTLVTEGRALDGHEIYLALVNNVQGIADGAPSWPSDGDVLPTPRGVPVDESYRSAAVEYVSWYADLYDEPSSDEGDAWYPDRLEYRFQIATGPSDSETAFRSAEYPGGSLDWYSFSHEPDVSLDPPTDSDLTTSGSDSLVPTPVRYPGMPVPRWWEFEDGEVHLDDLPAGPEDLSKLLLLDFSLIHSNDWFLIPIETPIGTLTRITDFTVEDAFGETTDIEGVRDRDWNTFMYHDLSAATDGEPGLLLPPTLGETLSSDPVERVYFSRDEMANMAFGVEERVESVAGDPVEREEFQHPTVEISRLHAGADVDVEDERVVLENPGDAPLALDGWELRATVIPENDPRRSPTIHTFGPVEIPPEGSVTVHSGVEPPGESDDAQTVFLGRSDPVWTTEQGAVTVLRPRDEFEDLPDDERENARFVTKATVSAPDPALPDYHLATSVPDHWFALKPLRPRSKPAERDTYRLALSLLLDADSMADPLSRVPQPEGRILNTSVPLRLYEEEVPRSGREVERHYQMARWTDGSTLLWSSRLVSRGRGEAASRLRYDVLSEPDGDAT